MKKYSLFIISFCLAAFNAIAFDISFGAGVDFGTIKTKYITDVPFFVINNTYNMSDKLVSPDDLRQFGFNFFSDFYYGTASIGGKFLTLPIIDHFVSGGHEDNHTINFLDFGIKLKYPFKILIVNLYPFMGADYLMFVSLKSEKNCEASRTNKRSELKGMNNPGYYLDRLALNVGAGADVNVKKLYFRGEFYYPFLLNDTSQKNWIDIMIKNSDYKFTLFNGGPVFAFSVGYKVFTK